MRVDEVLHVDKQLMEFSDAFLELDDVSMLLLDVQQCIFGIGMLSLI